jgi:hypothetical protein
MMTIIARLSGTQSVGIPAGRTVVALSCLCLVMVVAGCDRDQIRVYRVAKETAPTQPVPGSNDHPEGQSSIPRLTWTLPEGWQELPAGEMRVANFTLSGKEGQKAEVSVIPLPGVTGKDLDLVNMWRGQLGLPGVTADELVKQVEAVAIGADRGKLFEMASEKPVGESKVAVGLLVAVLEKDDVGWFFKLMGEKSFVQEQKAAFVGFLKTIGFQAGSESLPLASRPPPVSTNVKETPRDNAGKPIWVVPAGWQEAPAGQMLVAKFVVPGASGARAELNVSQLGGLGGGVLPNVNRWRNQLGLPPLAESDLDTQLQSLDLGGSKAMLVDMSGTETKTGQKARLLAAIVPQTGQTWFYRLMGNEQVIEHEKETFVKFVQTAKYRE